MTEANFPARIRQLSTALQEVKILMAGVQLGVFERLHAGAASSAELTSDLEATKRGMTILLDALAALGYLSKADGRYRNTPEAERYLVAGQPESIAAILEHRNQMFRSWARLEEVVLQGRSVPDSAKATLTDRRVNRAFILGMAEVSRGRLGPILDAMPLAEARRLVDLGGGPAHYACEAVRRIPELRATLVDLPLTVEVAREFIEQEGQSERVDTLVCNFYSEERIPLPPDSDLVLISQVFHAEGPEQNRALLCKIHDALPPGAWVVVSEQLVDEDRTEPASAAVFAINMLAGTERGSTYTEGEIRGWLEDAGFDYDRTVPIDPRTTLLVARKPA